MVDEVRDESKKETLEHISLEQKIDRDESKRSLPIVLTFFAVLVVVGTMVWVYWPKKSGKMVAIPEKKESASSVAVKSPPLKENTPKFTGLTAGQKKFNEIFTESLLKSALENAGKEFDLSTFRNMIRIAMNAEFLSDRPGMTWDNWQKKRAVIQDLARKELSDPIFLGKLWERYGDIVKEALRVSGKADRVKKLCAHAIPYFSGEFPHSRYVLLEDYYKTDTKLEREIQKRRYSKEAIHELTIQLDRKYRRLKANGLNDTDIYFFEFSMRRIREGGRDLAKEYGRILQDLSDSL